MTLLTLHQDFFKQTSGLATELGKIESAVKLREQALLAGIKKLTADVRKMASSAGKGQVQASLQDYFAQTTQVLEAWQAKVDSYDAGLSFRKQFGDSLLVFVYGKVKAGKSSLGNYIACGRTKPDEQWMKRLAKQLHRPHYFGGEANSKFAENINHKQGFQVGEAETTSCIQGFSLPGMTWVDSPGLHSVNTENGELAQKYVESADLIIYPMNSAQPGRETDLQELEALLKAGKRILVLITRADVTEQDVDDEGNLVEQLVMKSEQSRSDQEQHVQAGLDALCDKLGIKGADTSVLTVSVNYAEAHNNSPQAMRDSGMQELFERLQQVLHSDAIELKKQVPENNLQAFYRLLLADEGELSFAHLLSPLDSANTALDKLESRLDDLRSLAASRIEYQFAQGVESLVEQHAETGDTQALGQSLQQIVEEAVATHYRQPLADLYQEAAGVLQSTVHDMGLCVGLEFEQKTVRKFVDASAKTGAIGGGVGAVAGSVVGFFLGGPLGLAIGGAVGSLGGSALGSRFNKQEEHIIAAGDNREEIKAILLAKGTEQIDQVLTALNEQTLKEVILPMRNAIQGVSKQTLSFKNTIQEQANV